MSKKPNHKPNPESGAPQPSRSQGGRLARAPYNFVPLPQKVVPAEEPLPDHDRYHEDRHSGYFTVTLTTETPLYIRGMLTEKEAAEQARDQSKHKDKPDFFQRHGKPVIPGSSLRGMLRALVEIIAFGKLQPVSGKRLIYRAVFDSTSLGETYRSAMLDKNGDGSFNYPSRRLRGGYLKKTDAEYFIVPAQIFNGESFVFVPKSFLPPDKQKPQSIHEIWVKPASRKLHVVTNKRNVRLQVAVTDKISFTAGPDLKKAQLVISGHTSNRRWHPAIFERGDESAEIKIEDEMWRQYEEDRDMTRGIEARKLTKNGDPLFYLVDENGQLVFFGPTLMFRLPYPNSIADLILTEASNASITDMAEAIFGWVTRGDNPHDKREPIASRVSVSDAVVEGAQGDFYEAEFVPKILGGPKPTTFQHYLEQPREAYTDKSKLHHYATVPRPKLRGHKRYWLQRIKGIADIREPDPSKYGDTQHTRMKPVKAGITFKFTVRFENLSDVELGALAWALYLPCSPEHRHQLGMGKPYGMGMVKLTPTLHLIDRRARYTQLFDGDRWATAEREASADQFIAAFEKYIADKLGNGKRFRDLQRICELNVMLTPREPDKKFTYMTIEPENEYKDRPVLPRPSEVIGSACSGDAPSKSEALGKNETGYKVGDVLEGRILENAPADKPFKVRLDEVYGSAVVTAQGDSTPRMEGNRVYLQVVEGNPRFKPISKKEAEALRRSKQG